MPRFMLLHQNGADIITVGSTHLLDEAVVQLRQDTGHDIHTAVLIPDDVTWAMTARLEASGANLVAPATEAMRLDPRLPRAIDERTH